MLGQFSSVYKDAAACYRYRPNSLCVTYKKKKMVYHDRTFLEFKVTKTTIGQFTVGQTCELTVFVTLKV